MRAAHLVALMLSIPGSFSLFACADPGAAGGGALASDAPSLGKADGADRADRECQVVLRSVYRRDTACEGDGSCAWEWPGALEVAEDALAEGVTAGVLYRLSTDTAWWEVAAERGASASPGFARFEFVLADHLFGPETAIADGTAIELVPFLRLADGSRVFDHNRWPDDFRNHELLAATGWAVGDGGVCTPNAGTVWFTSDWQEIAQGALRQGGYLSVQYDIDRLPDCRGTHNGHPAWDVIAWVKFLPGAQLSSASVRELESSYGVPTNVAHDKPYVVAIPDDATSVELWFHNYTGAGSSCQAWDSNLDANYRFDVRPPASHPRCADHETWTSIHGGEPTCVGYDVAAHADASGCELYLEGFGHGYEGHYGIPFEWLVGYLRAAPAWGEVVGAGMLTRYRDPRDGELHARFSLGAPAAPGVWKTGFTYLATSFGGPGGGYAYGIEQVAFFADVRRPAGDVVRVWQSRGGANYGWGDAFSLPTTTEYIPYGNVQWANDAAGVYDARNACR
jgi:hypothetical protein